MSAHTEASVSPPQVRRRAVVIGAGVSGLATAALLLHEGLDVTVLEQRDEVGGRAGTWERDGFVFDTGPSWFLMPEVFDHFYRMLGTSLAEQLDLVRVDPAYRVFFEPAGAPGAEAAEPLVLSSGIDAVAASFEAIEPGAGAAIRKYLESAGDAYRLSVDRFLYNPFTRPSELWQPQVLRRLPRLVRMLSESLHRRVGRTVRDQRLQKVLEFPAVFLASSPFTAPAMYHLMSHLDLSDGVYYPRGGFSELIRSMRRLADGAEFVMGAEATRILTSDSQVTGVEWRDRSGEVSTIDADVVVSTVDMHHTETRLLDPEDRFRPKTDWDRVDAGPSAVIAMLGVDGPIPQLEHHSLFFADDWRDNFEAIRDGNMPERPSFYVCMPSHSDRSVAPEGSENLFILIPGPAAPSLGSGGLDGQGDPAVEAAVDRAIDALAARAGIPDLRERILVRRTLGPRDFEREFSSFKGSAIGYAHTLRQSAMFRGRTASRRVSGLYAAGGTTVPGVGVPMCLISAELVVKHLRGDSSPGPLPEPAGVPSGSSTPLESRP
ncbi:phytoene desaturase family protein [Ruicaihuangia caeni]|uniref:Phytoene desaturase family protein n=1 Tax=Ruicaihuangia caeni TaxID=3042517 RepID=A0AAW6TB85_9MICO|nr:phytoene desaturase family protein [Klugiella sp. YN-L-19]MDI2098862.1 phytoene desaturase family protein [Klugiella sp. YN-L-19]